MRTLLAAFAVGMTATASYAADCAAVMTAMEAQAAAPHYRQTMTMKGQPALESIVIGDVFYVLTDGKWNKIQLKPGGRLGMLKQIVPDAASIKDCSVLGAETLDGVETTVMAYTPPPVPDMGESGPAKMWIGVSDGLPRRVVDLNGAYELQVNYDEVQPPIE